MSAYQSSRSAEVEVLQCSIHSMYSSARAQFDTHGFRSTRPTDSISSNRFSQSMRS